MKTVLFLFAALLLPAGFILAQETKDEPEENSPEVPICTQPSKIDEFTYAGFEAVKDRLELFGLQLKNGISHGYVIGYGGRHTRSGEGSSIAYEIKDHILALIKEPVDIDAFDGGHRESPTIELFITPAGCRDRPEATPSVSLEDLDYKEETAALGSGVVRKSTAEMQELILDEITPNYTAAAKAVRASGQVVLVVTVDQTGRVIDITAIDGHPLLRASAIAAVRRCRFKTLQDKKTPVKYGGKIIVDFDRFIEDSE